MATINPDEITSIIKEKLQNYEAKLDYKLRKWVLRKNKLS